MHVGQAEVAALEFVGQAFVVDAQQVQAKSQDSRTELIQFTRYQVWPIPPMARGGPAGPLSSQ